MKEIIGVIKATFAVAKRKPEKKFRLVRDSNPSLLRYLLNNAHIFPLVEVFNT